MSWWLPSSLRSRLVLLVVIPLVPGLLLLTVDALRVRKTARDRAANEVAHVAHLAAAYHDRRLEETRRFLTRLAADSIVRFGDRQACAARLATVVASHQEYPNIGVVAADGLVECSAIPADRLTRLSAADNEKVVTRALRSGEFEIGDYTVGPISHRPVILTGVPIASRTNRAARALVASLDLAWFGEFGVSAVLPPSGVIAVIDRDARIVARYPADSTTIGVSVRGNPIYGAVVQMGGAGVALGPGPDGVDRLFAFAKIRGADRDAVQFVVAGIGLDALYGDANRWLWRNLTLLSLGFVISIACAWWLGSVSVIRPVHRMLDATKRIASGELAARALVAPAARELASLGDAFDHMADVIEQRSREDANAAEALRRERDYVRHIIDVTPALVCGVLPNGKTSFVNPAVETATGYSARELIGRNWWRTFYPGDHYAQVERLFDAFASGPVRDFEMDLTTASGSVKTVSWSSLNKLGPNDEVIEVIGFGMDITQRKLAERERDLFEVQLRHAQKLEAIGELAAGIAHEINTPTQYIGDNMRFLGDSFTVFDSVVAGFRDLTQNTSNEDALRRLAQARDGVDVEELDYLLQEIPRAITQSLEGVDRVSRIVRAMKDFSHPGSEHRAPIDLNRALETTVTVATNEWKYVADVVMDFDATLPSVLGHAGELNQAFLNLIVNASHAISDAGGESGERGVIQISTRCVADGAEVRVSDTGTGISERIRDRIFDPFFTTKPAGRGTGQGLALCHSVIVQRHGGGIRFETEVGRGTTFIVTLPASAHSGAILIEDAA